MTVLLTFPDGEEPLEVRLRINAAINELRSARREWSAPFDGVRCYYQGNRYNLLPGGNPNDLPTSTGSWERVEIDEPENPAPVFSGSFAGLEYIAGEEITPVDFSTYFTGSGALSYVITPQLPVGLTLSNSGMLTGTPGEVVSQTNYTVLAFDTYGQAAPTNTFPFAVIPAPPGNQPPVAQSIPDQTATVGVEFTLDITGYFTDPEDDTLTFTSTLPGWLTMTSGVMIGTPDAPGTHTIVIRADDGEDTVDSMGFDIVVS